MNCTDVRKIAKEWDRGKERCISVEEDKGSTDMEIGWEMTVVSISEYYSGMGVGAFSIKGVIPRISGIVSFDSLAGGIRY